MKKTLAFLLITGLITGLAAHAQPVYSNIVGMVKVTANRGAYTYVGSNFLMTDGPVTVSDFFVDSLPSDSRVFFWVTPESPSEEAGYQTAIYGSRSGWSNGDLEIDRAKGFIISIPSNASEESYEVLFSGSVPLDSEEASTNIVLEAGLTLTTSPYPVALKISEANFNPQESDRIHLWTGSGWSSSTYGSRSGWSNDLTINPGMAFFYQSADTNARTWQVSNPIAAE